MKYVVLMHVDKPSLWHNWHSGDTGHFYRSPICDTKEEAKEWLKEKLDNFPSKCINEYDADKEYYIHQTLVAFDEDETEDIEIFLKNWISDFTNSFRYHY